MHLSKLFLTLAGGLLALGLLSLVMEKLGLSLGKLPGDIHIRGQNGSFYFPLTTCLLLSVIVSLIFRWLTRR